MRDGLSEAIERTRREAAALAVAARDPRTPWYARLVAALTVGLALSPIDPVPDFVPVLGYLDDLVFVPVGVALAWRLAPAEVRADARRAADEVDGGAVRYVVAGLIVLGWLVVIGWIAMAVAGWR